MDVKESFLVVHDQHADALYRFCMARTGNNEVAHDLTQDTFMRFWDALSKKGSIEHPRALLYRIARNAIIDWYRKHKSESLDAMRETGFDLKDTRTLEHGKKAEYAHILTVLHKLKPAHQEVILLRYVEGLPPKEIAKTLEESTNVISVRINRAIKELQGILIPNRHE